MGADNILVTRRGHAQKEVVPALEYVLEPTYSLNGRDEEERSSTIVLVGKTGDSTCCLRDSKDRYLCKREQ